MQNDGWPLKFPRFLYRGGRAESHRIGVLLLQITKPLLLLSTSDTPPLQIHRCRRSRCRPLLLAVTIARTNPESRVLELPRFPKCLHCYRNLRRPCGSHVGGFALLVYKGPEICQGEAVQTIQFVLGRVLPGIYPLLATAENALGEKAQHKRSM